MLMFNFENNSKESCVLNVCMGMVAKRRNSGPISPDAHEANWGAFAGHFVSRNFFLSHAGGRGRRTREGRSLSEARRNASWWMRSVQKRVGFAQEKKPSCFCPILGPSVGEFETEKSERRLIAHFPLLPRSGHFEKVRDAFPPHFSKRNLGRFFSPVFLS